MREMREKRVRERERDEGKERVRGMRERVEGRKRVRGMRERERERRCLYRFGCPNTNFVSFSARFGMAFITTFE